MVMVMLLLLLLMLLLMLEIVAVVVVVVVVAVAVAAVAVKGEMEGVEIFLKKLPAVWFSPSKNLLVNTLLIVVLALT